MRDFLEDSGEVGRDLLAVDWAATPIGPPEEWPQALVNSVRILLTSRFSMWMAWGPELTFFCNEAYRRDTLGTKYPWALGRPASDVWSEIWPDIGPRIERVMTTGMATWDESLLLFLERSGYVEESYHTFSYSPLAADDGTVCGMLCVVKEDTEQVISSRRMMTLRDLGTRGSEQTEAETISAICEALSRNPHSLPFTAIYAFTPDGEAAVRAGTTGFPDSHHPAVPAIVAIGDQDAPWPVGELIEGHSAVVDLQDERFTDLPCGAWPEPPRQALVLPIAQSTHTSPYGFLVVGLNRYCELDDSYRGFVDLIVTHLAAAITDARAIEFEKQRAETLARIDQAKTDFFTNVSHEFRTPLTLLLGPAADALADADEALGPAQQNRLEVINRNAQRLLKLVNSLLEFSRLESGRATAHFEQLDLAGYTSELASMFESAADRAGLTLTIDCAPLSTRPYVDHDHWAKIVLNLVSNALKFTFEGGITVTLREQDGAAALSVTDTGIGIAEAELPHLFERFHRVQGARSRTFEGSGIGLALVAELTALHGGEVSAESTPGQGTTVTVRVPMTAAHLPPDQVDRRPRVDEVAQPADVAQQAQEFVSEALRWLDNDGAEAPAVPDPARPCVLVVDDNADMREYVAGLLAADYDIVTAGDGIEALEKVSERRPDLVLTDVMMPRLDGFGLLAKLQADPATTGVPVVMLSARAGEEGTVEGLEAGADDYLVKPFSARELRARVRVNLELDRSRRVRASLERSQALLAEAQRIAKVGSWEADLEADTLEATDEFLRIIEMTREEFEDLGYRRVIADLVHPDDLAMVADKIARTSAGSSIQHEMRVVLRSGAERLLAVRGEVARGTDEPRRFVRGSLQDVTEQRRAEQALASARASEQAAARESAIADELQRNLLPERDFDLEHLDVATYYRAGVQGTQVGGDWYDIIELGAGRTAFVVGDVMGSGVRAAAAMGQLRSAVRAFAKLDLPPAEVLEHLDGIVQDLGEDQIVTCIYAIFDSTDQRLRFANAGHLPPLLVAPGEPVRRLDAAGTPLGAGFYGLETVTVQLSLGATVAFYTDGLVEQRSRDIDVGIDELAEELRLYAGAPVAGLPGVLVQAMLPEGPDDDIAIMLARVNAEPFDAAVSLRLAEDEPAVANARRVVSGQLRAWELSDEIIEEVVLMASELVTNAFMHGRPPIDIRLRRTDTEVVLEVQDRAAYRPRRRRASAEDEDGRGLQIVAILADRWGSRPTGTGKSVWFSRSLVDDDVEGS